MLIPVRTVFVSVTTLTLVTMLFLGGARHAEAQADTDLVLMRVNGEPYTRTDLGDRELWSFRQHVSTAFPQTIANAVDIMVIVQHGRTLGFTMTDEMFHDLILAQMKSNHLETEDQWRTGFARGGYGSLADFRREKEREMIIQRVQIAEIIDKVPLSDDEALAYYRQHSGQSAAVPSLEIVGDIRRTAITGKRQQAWNDFLARLRSQAVIEWPIAAVKQAYDEGLAQLAAQGGK